MLYLSSILKVRYRGVADIRSYPAGSFRIILKNFVNTFENIILTNGIDYMSHVNILDADINGCINCRCSISIKIGFRSKSNSFQLSAYLKHLKNSRCSMIKKKKQGLDNVCSINNKLSNFVLQDDNSNMNNTQNVSDEENFVDEDDNFSTTINNPVITASNCSGTKTITSISINIKHYKKYQIIIMKKLT